eukprot:TRINITY_DN5809_c0_g1_i10.p1 TRINITY_DN5809_c0_g1~~TRINITY_DN5809_c0_g1_i10.p1  ORF type:complete len:4348 (-),score=882.14 TRINITY_DN5809_c0_g1_i10:23-13066(-)
MDPREFRFLTDQEPRSASTYDHVLLKSHADAPRPAVADLAALCDLLFGPNDASTNTLHAHLADTWVPNLLGRTLPSEETASKMPLASHLADTIITSHKATYHELVHALLPRMDIHGNEASWETAAAIIVKYMGHCTPDLARTMVKAILTQVQGLPRHNLTLHLLRNVHHGLGMIDQLVCPSQSTRITLKAGHMLQPAQRYPPYLVMSELSQLSPSSASQQGPALHWAFFPWVQKYLLRTSRLGSILIENEYLERCRIAGRPRQEDTDAARSHATPAPATIPMVQLEITPTKTWGIPLCRQFCDTLCQAQSQGASNQGMRQILMPNTSLLHPASVPPAQQQMLVDMIVQRIALLCTRTGHTAPGTQAMHTSPAPYVLADMTEGQWGTWQALADQVYSWVDTGCVPFDKLVYALAAHRPPLRDPSIPWLLSLCVHIKHVSEILTADIFVRNGPNFGFILPALMELHGMPTGSTPAASSPSGGGLSAPTPATGLTGSTGGRVAPSIISQMTRESGMQVVFLRLINFVGSTAQQKTTTEILNYLTKYKRMLENSMATGAKWAECRQWYQQRTEKIDFYSVTEQIQIIVAVLSNFPASPLPRDIYEFLLQPSQAVDMVYARDAAGGPAAAPVPPLAFPGGQGCVGKVRPLPVSLLACLSVRCRHTLMITIEQQMFGKQNNPPSAMPPIGPAILETYARLMYLTPSARSSRFFIHLCLIDNLPEIRFHALLELVSYRLLRFYTHQREQYKFLMDTYDHLKAMAAGQFHQMYRTLETLLTRVTSILQEVVPFSKMDLGPTVSRMLVLGLARTIKVNGIHDYSATREIPALLQRWYDLTGYVWSSNTIKYFPEPLRSFYEKLGTSLETPARQKVTLSQVWQEYNQGNMHAYFTQMDKTVAQPSQLVQFYKGAPQKRPLILPLLWISDVPRERVFPLIYSVFMTFPAQEWIQLAYSFIDCWLDELLQPSPASQQQGSLFLRETLPPQRIIDVATHLSQFMFTWYLLPPEATLLALCGRDDDPNTFPILEHILLEPGPLRHRIDIFTTIMASGPTPKRGSCYDDSFFAKNADFNTKFPDAMHPPLMTNPSNPYLPKPPPALPIYYSNTCLSLLPVIDVIIARLIENNEVNILLRVLDAYAPLYAYHDMPITHGYNLLYYYAEAPVFRLPQDTDLTTPTFHSDTDPASVKARLMKLVDAARPTWSDTFAAYVRTTWAGGPRNTEAVSSVAYFESIVSRVEAVVNTISLSSARVPVDLNKSIDNFKEMPSKTQEILTVAALELLASPLPEREVVRRLLATLDVVPTTNALIQIQRECVDRAGIPFYASPGTALSSAYSPTTPALSTIGPPPPTPTGGLRWVPPASVVSAVGVLIAMLPATYHDHFYTYVIECLNSPTSLLRNTFCDLDGLSCGPLLGRLFLDYSWNMLGNLDCPENKTLLLLHTFFHHACIEQLHVCVRFVQAFSPLPSIQCLFMLTKIFGPFIYRMSSSPRLLWSLVTELFVRLFEIDGQLSRLFVSRPEPFPFPFPLPHFFSGSMQDAASMLLQSALQLCQIHDVQEVLLPHASRLVQRLLDVAAPVPPAIASSSSLHDTIIHTLQTLLNAHLSRLVTSAPHTMGCVGSVMIEMLRTQSAPDICRAVDFCLHVMFTDKQGMPDYGMASLLDSPVGTRPFAPTLLETLAGHTHHMHVEVRMRVGRLLCALFFTFPRPTRHPTEGESTNQPFPYAAHLVHTYPGAVAVVVAAALARAFDPEAAVCKLYQRLLAILGPPARSPARQSKSTSTRDHAAWARVAIHLPTSNFRASHFQRVLAYLGGTMPADASGSSNPFEWVQRMVMACHVPSLVHTNDRSVLGDDVMHDVTVSHAGALLWGVWEAARLCMLMRLRSPYGNPVQTFEHFERLVKEATTNKQPEGSHQQEGGVATRHLLLFLDSLEKHIYNAYEGTLVLPPAPKSSVVFFTANKKVCEDWFARLRGSVLRAGVMCGAVEDILMHTHHMLVDLTGAPKRGTSRDVSDVEGVVFPMLDALCWARDPDTIQGMGHALEHIARTGNIPMPQMPYLEALALQAACRYEDALAAYSRVLEASSSHTPLCLEFLQEQVRACYTSLADWEGMHTWEDMLAKVRKGTQTTLPMATRDPAYIRALASFDLGDVQAARNQLDLAQEGASLHKWHAPEAIMLKGLLSGDHGGIDTLGGFIRATQPYMSPMLASVPSRQVQGVLGVAHSMYLLASDGPDHSPTRPKALDPHMNDVGTWTGILRACRTRTSQTTTTTTAIPQKTNNVLTLQVAKLARVQRNYALASRILGDAPSPASQDVLSQEVLFEHAKLDYAQSRHDQAIATLTALVGSLPLSPGLPPPLLALRSRVHLKLASWGNSSRSLPHEAAYISLCGTHISTPAASTSQLPAVDDLCEQLLQRATEGHHTTSAKAWQRLGSWHYRRAHHVMQEAATTGIALTQDEDTALARALHGMDLQPEEEGAIRQRLGMFEDGSYNEQNASDPSTPTHDPAGQFASFVAHTLSRPPDQAPVNTEPLMEIWSSVRRRLTSHYTEAVTCYFAFLTSLYGREEATNDEEQTHNPHSIYVLRLLRLLVRYGPLVASGYRPHAAPLDPLHAALADGFKHTPTRPWKDVVPQLFVRIDHFDAFVRDTVLNLLVRIAHDEPHPIIYPAPVGLSTHSASVQAKAHTDNTDDTAPAADEVNSPAIISYALLVKELEGLYPRLVAEVRSLLAGLTGITLLWEEAWGTALPAIYTDAHARMKPLREEIARVMNNPRLDYPTCRRIVRERHGAMMRPVLLKLEALCAQTVHRNPASPRESWFKQTFSLDIQSVVNALRNPPSDLEADFEHSLTPMKDMAKKLARLKTHAHLMSAISPVLARMSGSVVPLPGQPSHLTITGFEQGVAILPTKTRPKKLRILGSDGVSYPYLLKGREDMHMDDRVMQILMLVNSLLARDRHAAARGIHARHYRVIPLGPKSGLIQWVRDTHPLFNVYKQFYRRTIAAKTNTNADNIPVRPADMFYAKLVPLLQERGISNVMSRREWPRDVREAVFRELRDQVPRQLLFKELWASSATAAEWHAKTQRYAGSLAVMSMVGYVLGLGDRHMDNILLDHATGDIVHIDYNICFEKGRRLRVPERVPFRLTHTLEGALGVCGRHGAFRAVSEIVLGVLRSSKEAMMTLLEAFVHDPVVDLAAEHDDDLVRRRVELMVYLNLYVSRVAEISEVLNEGQRKLVEVVTRITPGLKLLCEQFTRLRPLQQEYVALKTSQATLTEQLQHYQVQKQQEQQSIGLIQGHFQEAQNIHALLARQAAEAQFWHEAIAPSVQHLSQGALVRSLYEDISVKFPSGDTSTLVQTLHALSSQGPNAFISQASAVVGEYELACVRVRDSLLGLLSAVAGYQRVVADMPEDYFARTRCLDWANLLRALLASASSAPNTKTPDSLMALLPSPQVFAQIRKYLGDGESHAALVRSYREHVMSNHADIQRMERAHALLVRDSNSQAPERSEDARARILHIAQTSYSEAAKLAAGCGQVLQRLSDQLNTLPDGLDPGLQERVETGVGQVCALLSLWREVETSLCATPHGPAEMPDTLWRIPGPLFASVLPVLASLPGNIHTFGHKFSTVVLPRMTRLLHSSTDPSGVEIMLEMDALHNAASSAGTDKQAFGDVLARYRALCCSPSGGVAMQEGPGLMVGMDLLFTSFIEGPFATLLSDIVLLLPKASLLDVDEITQHLALLKLKAISTLFGVVTTSSVSSTAESKHDELLHRTNEAITSYLHGYMRGALLPLLRVLLSGLCDKVLARQTDHTTNVALEAWLAARAHQLALERNLDQARRLEADIARVRANLVKYEWMHDDALRSAHAQGGSFVSSARSSMLAGLASGIQLAEGCMSSFGEVHTRMAALEAEVGSRIALLRVAPIGVDPARYMESVSMRHAAYQAVGERVGRVTGLANSILAFEGLRNARASGVPAHMTVGVGVAMSVNVADKVQQLEASNLALTNRYEEVVTQVQLIQEGLPKGHSAALTRQMQHTAAAAQLASAQTTLHSLEPLLRATMQNLASIQAQFSPGLASLQEVVDEEHRHMQEVMGLIGGIQKMAQGLGDGLNRMLHSTTRMTHKRETFVRHTSDALSTLSRLVRFPAGHGQEGDNFEAIAALDYAGVQTAVASLPHMEASLLRQMRNIAKMAARLAADDKQEGEHDEDKDDKSGEPESSLAPDAPAASVADPEADPDMSGEASGDESDDDSSSDSDSDLDEFGPGGDAEADKDGDRNPARTLSQGELKAPDHPRPAPSRHLARNAYALAILRRVRAKLDGRDKMMYKEDADAEGDRAGDGDRPAFSVARQVEWLIQEATSTENLAAMYEGWTPWL